MAMRPSILIGLGSSGSEIIGRVFQKYRALEEQLKSQGRSHLMSPDQVQFIAIDSDQNSFTGMEFVRQLGPGRHLPMSNPDATALRVQLAASDKFFPTWWDERFTDVGPAVDGAGTVPAKGRLVFWGGPARAGTFEAIVTNAISNATTVMHSQGTSSVAIYLVLTICGGSGSGIFIDVATWIRQLFRRGGMPTPDVLACLVLPSVVTLRADTSFHDQVEANGFGALIGLDFWQKGGQRPDYLRILMEAPNVTLDLSSGESPFDLAYLFTRTNEQGRGLLQWDHYAGMIADGLAAEVMGESSAGAQSRANDLIMKIGSKQVGGRSAKYGSFSIARMRFRPEVVAPFLGQVAGQTLGQIIRQAQSPIDVMAQARSFFEKHAIRERADRSDTPLNEIYDALVAPRRDIQAYPDISLTQPLRDKAINKKTLRSKLADLQKQQQARLTGEVSTMQGAALLRIVEANRLDLATRVLGASPPDQKAPGGLDWWIAELLASPEGGLGAARGFLVRLKQETQQHKAEIDEELKGNTDAGKKGLLTFIAERQRNETDSMANEFDRAANRGSEVMFRLWGGSREDGARLLEDTWWSKWLETSKKVLVRNQTQQFHDQLIDAIDKALSALDVLDAVIAGAEKDLSEAAVKQLGRSKDEGQYVLETTILEHPEVSTRAFLSEPVAFDVLQRTSFGEHLKRAYATLRLAAADVARSQAQVTPPTARAPQLLSVSAIDSAKLALQSQMAEALQNAGADLFRTRLEDMSIWDALVVEGQANGYSSIVDLQNYASQRIKAVGDRAVPFWGVNSAKVMAAGQVAPQSVTVSYDDDVYQQFMAQTDWTGFDPMASLRSAVRATQRSASPVGSKTLEVRVATGGLPLHMLHEPPLLKDSYDALVRSGARLPVFADKRYNQLPKTFEPDETGQVLLDFLLAEHFGIIQSPFVRGGAARGEGVQTSGIYKHLTRQLGKSRIEAIQSLMSGGANADRLQEIRDTLERRLADRYNAQELLGQHCVMYDRLYRATDRPPTDPKVSAELNAEYEAVKEYLATQFALKDHDQIMENAAAVKQQAGRAKAREGDEADAFATADEQLAPKRGTKTRARARA